MGSFPKISVVTACYNHGEYIGALLDSVFQQGFPDFEVIIVNDGSTDGTRQILDAVDHNKVKIIHTGNQGPSAARNLAISNARAPFIMNLDADDKITPGLFEKAYDHLKTHPETGIVYCEANLYGAAEGPYIIEDFSIENMLYDNRIPASSFFRKNDWEAVGGYCTDFITGPEDWDFWLSLLELGREVHKIPHPHLFYRVYDRPELCRTGRNKMHRLNMLKRRLEIFHRHQKLYARYPEARAFHERLEKKLENENFFLRIMRNRFYQLKRMINK